MLIVTKDEISGKDVEELGFVHNTRQGNHGITHEFRSLAFSLSVIVLNPGVNVGAPRVNISSRPLYPANIGLSIPLQQGPQMIGDNLFIS